MDGGGEFPRNAEGRNRSHGRESLNQFPQVARGTGDLGKLFEMAEPPRRMRIPERANRAVDEHELPDSADHIVVALPTPVALNHEAAQDDNVILAGEFQFHVKGLVLPEDRAQLVLSGLGGDIAPEEPACSADLGQEMGSDGHADGVGFGEARAVTETAVTVAAQPHDGGQDGSVCLGHFAQTV